MAKETKITDVLSTKRWKELQTLPPDMGVQLQDGKFVPYYGMINGKRGYNLLVLSNGKCYSSSISKEKLTQFEQMKEGLEKLGYKFVSNRAVNPITDGSIWKRLGLDSTRDYEARISGNRDFYVLWAGGYIYKMSTRNRQYGREVDWLRALGVYVSDWLGVFRSIHTRFSCVVFYNL